MRQNDAGKCAARIQQKLCRLSVPLTADQLITLAATIARREYWNDEPGETTRVKACEYQRRYRARNKQRDAVQAAD